MTRIGVLITENVLMMGLNQLGFFSCFFVCRQPWFLCSSQPSPKAIAAIHLLLLSLVLSDFRKMNTKKAASQLLFLIARRRPTLAGGNPQLPSALELNFRVRATTCDERRISSSAALVPSSCISIHSGRHSLASSISLLLPTLALSILFS